MTKPHFPLSLVTLLTGLALLAGCTREPPAEVQGPPVVTVAVAVEQNVTDHVDFSGKTAAIESVQLRARVGGYLQKVEYKEGNEVKKDQALFEIDQRPYQAELDQAQARVKASQANLAQAESEYRRNLRLRQTTPGAVSEEDVEKSLRTRDVAAASLEAARANVRLKQLNLDFTSVLSPIDGRADKADTTLGNLVSANLNDATVLTNLVRLDPMYAYFDVDELTMFRLVKMVQEGKVAPREEKDPEVLMGLGLGTDYPLRGTVDFVSNQVNPSVGTITVRGKFPNKNQFLRPGLFVRIRLPLGEPHKALLVSDRALGTSQGQKFLFVLDGKNKVEFRPVTVGALHGDLREVVAGLEPGERVVVNGLLRVRPGVTVEPKPGEMVPEAAEKK